MGKKIFIQYNFTPQNFVYLNLYLLMHEFSPIDPNHNIIKELLVNVLYHLVDPFIHLHNFKSFHHFSAEIFSFYTIRG